MDINELLHTIEHYGCIYLHIPLFILTSSNGSISRVTGPSCGEFIGHRWIPLNSPHKGRCRRALISSLIWAWINGWVNTRRADDSRRHRAHSEVILVLIKSLLLRSTFASYGKDEFMIFETNYLSRHSFLFVQEWSLEVSRVFPDATRRVMA